MFLYSLTIQPPSHVVQAVLGQFAGTKEQLIITAAGSRLTLLRPDPSQGKVITLLSHDIFGIIRSIAPFRLAGSSKGMSLKPTGSHSTTAVRNLTRLNRLSHYSLRFWSHNHHRICSCAKPLQPPSSGNVWQVRCAQSGAWRILGVRPERTSVSYSFYREE